MPRFCTTGAASARAFRANRIMLPHRQQGPFVTWVDGLITPGSPASHLSALDASYCVTGSVPAGGAYQLIATLDFGSPKFVQTVQLLAVTAQDFNGSGNTCGVAVEVWDDTLAPFLAQSLAPGGGNSTLVTLGRRTRKLFLFAAQVAGFGTSPATNFDTQAYFDCLDVLGER